MTICQCCPAVADFTLPADDADTLLCRDCLDTWRASWPEDMARATTLGDSADAHRTLHRAICGALNINSHLLTELPGERDHIGAAEANKIAAMRIAAQVEMTGRCAALEAALL